MGVWGKQLRNNSQARGNALEGETWRLACQKGDGKVAELKFISNFTGIKWQILKGYFNLAKQDKMRNNGCESKPNQCTWQKAHILTAKMINECDGFSMFWWLQNQDWTAFWIHKLLGSVQEKVVKIKWPVIYMQGVRPNSLSDSPFWS